MEMPWYVGVILVFDVAVVVYFTLELVRYLRKGG